MKAEKIPLTLFEAEAYYYNLWPGNPKGDNYVPGRCAYEITSKNPLFVSGQCIRKATHGPNKLFCWRHAGIVTVQINRLQRSGK